MAEILQCPVCGRLPKIKHRSHCGEHLVVIECKPLFGKFHEQALAYGLYSPAAYIEAIRIWNGRVKYYEERHKNANA